MIVGAGLKPAPTKKTPRFLEGPFMNLSVDRGKWWD